MIFTTKSLECIAIIKKHSKNFGGSLEDPDVKKLCGCSRNSYNKKRSKKSTIYFHLKAKMYSQISKKKKKKKKKKNQVPTYGHLVLFYYKKLQF